MLIIRLLIVLLVIAAIVLLGMYVLYDDKIYLQYFKKTLKFTFFIVLGLGLMLMLRRFFYVV